MYKEDLAFNNLQCLICHKPNLTKNYIYIYIYIYVLLVFMYVCVCVCVLLYVYAYVYLSGHQKFVMTLCFSYAHKRQYVSGKVEQTLEDNTNIHLRKGLSFENL